MKAKEAFDPVLIRVHACSSVANTSLLPNRPVCDTGRAPLEERSGRLQRISVPRNFLHHSRYQSDDVRSDRGEKGFGSTVIRRSRCVKMAITGSPAVYPDCLRRRTRPHAMLLFL